MPAAQGVRAGRAYVELGVHDRLARGLARAARRLRAFGTQVQAIGARLAKLGAVAAVPFAAGIKVFADFERQMANVSTMLDEPEKHMGRFTEGIRRMAVEFGESTEALETHLVAPHMIEFRKATEAMRISLDLQIFEPA